MIFLALDWILNPIFMLMNFKKPPSTPPIKNHLLKLSATTLAKKIRNGELSSQTIVEAYIERIKEVNPFLNAVVEDRFEEALKEAKLCDEKLKNGEIVTLKLQTEKPLYGVPVSIKENCSVKGMSYTGCSVMRKGARATEDGGAVKLLKDAGAIPLVVTNTSELCAAIHAKNRLFGSTMNPYDRRKSPGGSSGGEGALIAAGGSVLGIGSDFVGSVRIPALFNGIFGHKPTTGVVPINGHFPITDQDIFQMMLTIGPLTRCVDDLYLAMKVLGSKSKQPLRLDESVDIKNLRIFYIDDVRLCTIKSVSPDIRDSIHKATQYLSEKGAHVEQLSQDWLENSLEQIIIMISEVEIQSLLNPDNREEKNSFFEFTKSLVGLSQHTTSTAFIQLLMDTKLFMSDSKKRYYRKSRQEFQKKINDALKDNGVLIFPTFHCAAPFSQKVFLISACSAYSGLVNVFGLPSTHVPMGLNKDGLPIGFQVISAHYQDHLCLAVAKELEKQFGSWIPPS